MENCASAITAQPIIRAASAFWPRRSDPVPDSAAIDLADDTLVITLEEVFSPVEKAPPDAGSENAEMRETYRQFIADALASMRQHLQDLADENPPVATQVFPRIFGGRRNGWSSRDPVGRGRV
jgi:hypothetical protein